MDLSSSLQPPFGKEKIDGINVLLDFVEEDETNKTLVRVVKELVRVVDFDHRRMNEVCRQLRKLD